MSIITKDVFPYDSLDKYTDVVIQCPICHYFIRVNPKSDSMKYRLLDKQHIQFLTKHSFNSFTHTIVIEFANFSFSKIIDFKESPVSSVSSTDHIFPLFHLVNVAEFKNFQDRIFELETNNNNLISSFKAKLDKLQLCYDQKDSEILLLDQTKNIINVQNSLLESEIASLRDDFASTFQQEIDSLTSEKELLKAEIFGSTIELQFLSLNNSQLTNEITALHTKITDLLNQLQKVEQQNTILTQQNNILSQQTSQKENQPVAPAGPDPRLLEILDQERKQKRTAIREKHSLEDKIKDLEDKIKVFETTYQVDSSDKYQQELHDFTISYEQKISELTLQLADKDEEIKLLGSKNSDSDPITSKSNTTSQSSKQFRVLVADEFLSLQRKFNEIQFDIMLSFYHTENIDRQLRNSFEMFFNQLITRTNHAGQVLLNNPDFSLFKDIQEINPHFKFSSEQVVAGLQIQALNIIFSDLCRYIFAIIKSVKASMEGVQYQIVPDGAEYLTQIPASINGDNITFSIPKSSFKITDLRVFRSASELYKDSLIFLSFDPSIDLLNSSYHLISHTVSDKNSTIDLQITNFFNPTDSFQLGSYQDGLHLIIQKIGFTDNLHLVKNFAEKNSLFK